SRRPDPATRQRHCCSARPVLDRRVFSRQRRERLPEHLRPGRRARAGARRQSRLLGFAAFPKKTPPLYHARKEAMKSNSVKKKLQSGGTAIGTMVFEFATTG